MIKRLQQQDDHKLVASVLAGDNRAFRVLAERHHGIIQAVVRGVLGDDPEVDDTVQKVIIRMFRGLSRFRGDAKFTSWVYRIAHNEAVSVGGRRTLPSVPLESIADPGHQDDNPEATYWQEVADRRLTEAMTQLDRKYRIVLELRYMGDRSYSEISELMELPMGTVKTNLYRAKAELKSLLERQRLRATG